MLRRLLTSGLLLLGLSLPVAAPAQVDTREGIYLQNQLLQLRQELEQLRRGGSSLGGSYAPPPRGGGGVPAGELVGQLLDRVGTLEEEFRRLQGRLEVIENQNRQLVQNVEKLQGDLDYRLQRLEGTGGDRPPPSGGSTGGVLVPPGRPTGPPPAPGPRPPERALADGQTALARRDFPAAEAAAREVLAIRNTPRAYDARFLLAEAEAGQRNWQESAIAYGDAYRANQRGTRAPEALVGFGTALANLNQRREACDAFAQAQSEFPGLRGSVRDRLDAGRQRAGCR